MKQVGERRYGRKGREMKASSLPAGGERIEAVHLDLAGEAASGAVAWLQATWRARVSPSARAVAPRVSARATAQERALLRRRLQRSRG